MLASWLHRAYSEGRPDNWKGAHGIKDYNAFNLCEEWAHHDCRTTIGWQCIYKSQTCPMGQGRQNRRLTLGSRGFACWHVPLVSCWLAGRHQAQVWAASGRGAEC